jgi:biopolymer transport protein ExbD
VVQVRADGFALNTTPVLSLDDLERRLRAAFEARPDGVLFVKVAGEVAYERVVAALDVAAGAGAARIGLVDEPEGVH